MKRTLIITISIIVLNNVCLFGQGTNRLLGEKVDIISDVIERIKDSAKCKKVFLTGLINTMQRKVSLMTSPVYNGIRFSSYNTDSACMEVLKKKYNYENYRLIEYSNVESYRTIALESSSLSKDEDTCIYCTKLYFEINCPIEGWENLELFDVQHAKELDNTAFYEKYYINKISIPIFIYSVTCGQIIKQNCIVVYELLENNKFKFSKRIIIN